MDLVAQVHYDTDGCTFPYDQLAETGPLRQVASNVLDVVVVSPECGINDLFKRFAQSDAIKSIPPSFELAMVSRVRYQGS